MKRRLQGLESGDERARFNRETFASISIGYDQSVIAPAKQNGQEAPGAVRLTLGTLLLGGTYRFNDKVSLNGHWVPG